MENIQICLKKMFIFYPWWIAIVIGSFMTSYIRPSFLRRPNNFFSLSCSLSLVHSLAPGFQTPSGLYSGVAKCLWPPPPVQLLFATNWSRAPVEKRICARNRRRSRLRLGGPTTFASSAAFRQRSADCFVRLTLRRSYAASRRVAWRIANPRSLSLHNWITI